MEHPDRFWFKNKGERDNPKTAMWGKLWENYGKS
jgi:hypothetical protein